MMSADRGEMDARALWLTAPRTLEFRRETVPPPSAGEVRVRVIASAISQGTEMLVYRGQVPPDLPLDLPTLAGGFDFPIKYGYAAVGRVLDVGAAVENCSPGDTVFVHHPHQDIFLVPASMAVRLPAGLDLYLGLFTANLETAVNVLLDTPLHIGETAVVFGQGTVGLLITHLLRHVGGGRIVAVDPLERRRDLALALGAHETMAPDEELPAVVRTLTGGRGADVVIEVSGSALAVQQAIECVAVEGTVVLVSWYGTKPVTLTLGGHFHRGRVRLRSSQVGRLNPDLSARWDHARRLAVVIDLLPRLRLEGLISHRFQFDEASSAYHLIDEHPDECVQVVLTYGE